MHFFENLFSLAFYLDSDGVAEIVESGDYRLEIIGDMARVDYHHHVEITLYDGLRDVEDVDLLFRKIGAYLGYDAYGIFPDYCDNASVHDTIYCTNDKYM